MGSGHWIDAGSSVYDLYTYLHWYQAFSNEWHIQRGIFIRLVIGYYFLHTNPLRYIMFIIIFTISCFLLNNLKLISYESRYITKRV